MDCFGWPVGNALFLVLWLADNVDGVMIDQTHGGGIAQGAAQQHPDELSLSGMSGGAKRSQDAEDVSRRDRVELQRAYNGVDMVSDGAAIAIDRRRCKGRRPDSEPVREIHSNSLLTHYKITS